MPKVAYKSMIQGIMSISSNADYSALSDAQVLERSRYHPALFSILVERYEAPFLRKAQSILKSHEDAQEVVQDTFTRIYLYADRYHPQEGATFSSWGYVILTRVALTRYNKLKRVRDTIAVLEPEHYESLSDKENFIEPLTVRDEVLSALARLPETAAHVLRLQFLEGKTQEEIAQQEGTSVSAIKTRVHRAKKLFKQITNHYDSLH